MDNYPTVIPLPDEIKGGFVTRVGHIMWGQQKQRSKKMTTERILKKWRREALEVLEDEKRSTDPAFYSAKLVLFSTHILHMTQELLDIQLLKKPVKKGVKK